MQGVGPLITHGIQNLLQRGEGCFGTSCTLDFYFGKGPPVRCDLL